MSLLSWSTIHPLTHQHCMLLCTGELQLPPSQILGNGCDSKETWNGEVYDLQVGENISCAVGG